MYILNHKTFSLCLRENFSVCRSHLSTAFFQPPMMVVFLPTGHLFWSVVFMIMWLLGRPPLARFTGPGYRDGAAVLFTPVSDADHLRLDTSRFLFWKQKMVWKLRTNVNAHVDYLVQIHCISTILIPSTPNELTATLYFVLLYDSFVMFKALTLTFNAF